MILTLSPIGTVHSPFKSKEDIDPLRYAEPGGFDSVQGSLEIDPEFAEGLDDIDGFSHLLILFVFHLSSGFQLRTKPLLDDTPRGVFATRSPHRPNPLGLTVVRLHQRNRNILSVSGIDMLEGTPILDIKPYTPRDQKGPIALGWLADKFERG